MRIFVGEDPFEVNPGDTVLMLKESIESKMGYPVGSSYTLTSYSTVRGGVKQARSFKIRSEHNGNTLESLGIMEGEIFYIDFEKPFFGSWDTRPRIHIRCPGETNLYIIGTESDTVNDIKREVRQYSQIPVERLTLTFQGTPLDDTKTLAECGVEILAGRVILKVVIKPAVYEERNVVEGSENALSYEDIEEGALMVNFPRTASKNGEGRRTEYNFGAYYKNSPSVRGLTQNPETRHPLTPGDFTRYIAHLVPKAGGGKKSRHRHTRRRNTRQSRRH
jgi:hypothetical protein